MCARYTLRANGAVLIQLFWEDQPILFHPDSIQIPRYNIAPTHNVWIFSLNKDKKVVGSKARWGLVPSTSRGPGTGPSMLNARSETLKERPSFSKLINSNRCAIPADGFFEWSWVGNQAQPYLFEFENSEPFCFAGLWDTWADGSGNSLHSCTILTTAPNAMISEIHDRMPVILQKDDIMQYLSPKAPIEEFTRTIEHPKLSRFPVTSQMGNPKFQGPDCVKRIQSPSLFDDL